VLFYGRFSEVSQAPYVIKKMVWLENSNSSVSLDDRKLAQLIENRQKLQARTTSQILSRQIPPDFPASSNIRSIAYQKRKDDPSPEEPESSLFSVSKPSSSIS